VNARTPTVARYAQPAVGAGVLARACVLVAVLSCLVLPCAGRAQDAVPAASERAVKAAFLYKFLSYVEWPAAAFTQGDAPIVVGVVGSDEVVTELQQIAAARSVDNRAVVVRRVREGESLAGLHALFVGRNEHARLPALVKSAQQRGVLIVTDWPGALDQGAAINFLTIDGRIRFEISVEAAERSGVKLSSRLLAVAQNVRTGS